jgi:hypothetical protein
MVRCDKCERGEGLDEWYTRARILYFVEVA